MYLGSTPNVNTISSEFSTPSDKPRSFVERIQGLGESLLGHHKSDCDCSTKGKSGKSIVGFTHNFKRIKMPWVKYHKNLVNKQYTAMCA